MLSDFLLIEAYYDTPEAARAYEDLIRQYGIQPIQKAISAGHIACRRIKCGAEKGRPLFWLTEKGRNAAQGIEVH